MSVQVLCYELRMSAPNLPAPVGPASEAPLATASELEGLHEHLERLLTESGFLHPGASEAGEAQAAPHLPARGARSERDQHPARDAELARSGEALRETSS